MRRSVRATAAAVAVVLSMGAGTSAAVAGDHAKTPAHAKPAKPAKPGKPAKIDKDRTLTLREVAREKAAVAKHTSTRALAGLPAEAVAAIAGNAAQDQAYLDTLVAQAKAAGTRTELRAVSVALRAVRPENYNQVVGALKEVATLTAAVEQARTEYAGNVEAEAALDDAEAALAVAEDGALAVRATSPKSALTPVEAALTEAEAALEAAVVAGTTTEDPTEDPEEPTEDPTEDPMP